MRLVIILVSGNNDIYPQQDSINTITTCAELGRKLVKWFQDSGGNNGFDEVWEGVLDMNEL